LTREFGLAGILGNKHASGTEIVAELGEAHLRTGLPICYTSADSVFQVAAHEERFGLEKLYRFCERAKELLEPMSIARVIARPFLGEDQSSFRRTSRRRDYTTPPPGETLLDRILANGGAVWSVGKIADIFAGRGISKSLKADDNHGLFDRTLEAMAEAPEGALVFSNFVDFDMLHGHRRDVPGYALALEAFDRRIPELEAALLSGDLVLATADHGCDPTGRERPHARERPCCSRGGAAVARRPAQQPPTCQTIAAHLGLGRLGAGVACF
jgi:phosphopentomutase